MGAPTWLWKALAIFPATGLFGIDYYAAGSIEGAIAKFLVNLITLGSWYVHDMLIALDGNKVSVEGLHFPFIETLSIQPGIISDTQPFSSSAKTLLFILLTSIAATIFSVASLLTSTHGIVGDISKGLQKVSGGATGLLGAFTGYTAYAEAKAAALAKVADLVPGGAELTSLAKTVGMAGGGALPPSMITADSFVLGTLFLIMISGFALSSIRAKSSV